MAITISNLAPRQHIQNMSDAASLEPHWGYAYRVVPCTNDAGSCEYLDVVYHSHDLGMLYCGIIWATILGLLGIWAVYHHSTKKEAAATVTRHEQTAIDLGTFNRIKASIGTFRRQYLLPDFARPVFGRTARVQVLVLAVLTGYLAVFSFVGIVYNTWITPVKNKPGIYNTRTSLGPWADRVGVLAYALTPLSVLLSSRESLLSLITGLPYQSFNFLHRWLGYIIVAQSILHTIGWSIIEIRLYQPQPTVARTWIKQLYMIWGVIAMFFLFALFVLSTPWAIKRTGYEVFRKLHYLLAVLYIGACWGHWSHLSCYLIPALIVWFIDRGVRLVRCGLLHYSYIEGSSTMKFRSTDTKLTLFSDSVNGDAVRLDFVQPQEPWAIGQHFYLCFPKLSIWQSHPFTPLNMPRPQTGGVPHAYILRAKKGETAKLARLAAEFQSTSVILNGPYGVSEVNDISHSTNILCVAGGTGISYVLPVLLSQLTDCHCSSTRKLQLVWAIRRKADMSWVQSELKQLYEASKSMDLKISVFVTREDSYSGNDAEVMKTGIKVSEVSVSSSSSSTATSSEKLATSPASGCCGSQKPINLAAEKEIELCNPPASRKQEMTVERRGSIGTTPAEMRHPDLEALVRAFVDNTVEGSSAVFASGPGGMISDLRTIVASLNNAKKVWRGDMRSSVELRCDDRLEW